ncbi:MAG: hypothetical protein CSYNP_02533 [Syntrophus sp. SKADARSKE-3]|nr:hypothetical protein [Syntrophus sp. SKADARSKE-3]
MRLKLKLKINRTIAGYGLAGVLILSIMLYLRFPGDIIKDYIITAIAARNPDAVLTMGSVSPSFPPGISFTNVTLGFRDNPTATLQVQKATLSVDYLGFFQGRWDALLEGNAYGGILTGHIPLSGEPKGEWAVNNIPLEKIAYLKERLHRQMIGKLKGTFKYKGSFLNAAGGSAQIGFTIAGGVYPLLAPFAGIDKLEFTRIDGEMALQNGTLKITKFKLTGDKVRCDLTGQIGLNLLDMESSTLELLSVIDIPGQQGRKLNLAIAGTVGNPAVRIGP